MDQTKTVPRTSQVFRMSPRQFRAAYDAGAFGESKVELLAGIPFVMTKNPPHEIVVFGLADVLRPIIVPAGMLVFEEKSAKLGSWRPVPDVAVVRGPKSNYDETLPGPSDITLIVEVSDTTYPKDRGLKYRRYAACGIPQYWIVKLDERLIECHFDPVGRGKAARYRSCMTYGEGDQLPLFDSSFPVSAILPRVAEKPSP